MKVEDDRGGLWFVSTQEQGKRRLVSGKNPVRGLTRNTYRWKVLILNLQISEQAHIVALSIYAKLHHISSRFRGHGTQEVGMNKR